MPRYRIQFKPQGAIPEDKELGVHLTPEVLPGTTEGCTPDCGESSWGVLLNDVTSTAVVHQFIANLGGFTASIEFLGTLCEGQCIEWELRQLSDASPPSMIADVDITPTGCTTVALAGGDDVDLTGLMFGVYATVDGQPLCEPVLFQAGACIVDMQPDLSYRDLSYIPLPDGSFDLDGSVYLDGAFFGRGPTSVTVLRDNVSCPDPPYTWVIVQTSGTSGHGEVLTPTGVPPISFDLEFTSLTDLTDAVFECTLWIDGVETLPPIVATFTCTNNLTTP